MPEVRKQSFYIYEICDVANSDKTITKIKAKNNVGEYPVYAATINKPFAYINFYNNEKPCLVVINDGAAGCTYLVNDNKYTIGKHATGLIPHDGIDIRYLQKVVEPIFTNIAKGYGLGNLPKADILNTKVEIPVNKDGTFNLNLQKELAEKYSVIEEQRNVLLQKRMKLQNMSVILPEDKNIKWAHPLVTDLFYPKGGNADFTKTWVSRNKGEIPLYSGTTTSEYARVNIAEYSGEYLTWCIDGLAGYIMYHKHRCTRGTNEIK